MSDLDIIPIPGYPDLYTRRIVVEMWQRAGSPHINDAGRLKATQQAARDAFLNGTGSPADDPNRPDLYPLAHVRFAALDVYPSARDAMIAAGFVYPYDYETWHAELPNVRQYPLVDSIPPDPDPIPITKETPPMYSLIPTTDGDIIIQSLTTGKRARIGSPYHVSLLQRVRDNNSNDTMLTAEVDIVGGYILAVNPPAEATVDTQKLADALGKISPVTDATAVKKAVADAIAASTLAKLLA